VYEEKLDYQVTYRIQPSKPLQRILSYFGLRGVLESAERLPETKFPHRIEVK